MNFADTVTYGSSTKGSEEMKQIINDDDVDRQGDTLIFNPYNSLNKEITLKEVQAILIDYGVPGIVHNLDLYKRLLDPPGVPFYLLFGEGSFHQFHGGVATNVPATEKMWDKFDDEYERLRGSRFDLIGYPKKPRVLGELNTESRPFFLNDELQSGGR